MAGSGEIVDFLKCCADAWPRRLGVQVGQYLMIF
jgi:hypothetical protein